MEQFLYLLFMIRYIYSINVIQYPSLVLSSYISCLSDDDDEVWTLCMKSEAAK